MPRALLLLSLLIPATAAPQGGDGDAQARLLETGRRIYQDGILPDATPLQALRDGGVTLAGSLAACGNCHRRSGFGQVEGRSQVPSLAGDILFAPGRYFGKSPPQGKAAAGMKVIAPVLDARPAYDTEALARALREGVDPAGRRFDDLMPRYQLDAAAFAALNAYLRQLSVAPAPGVSDEVLHLGTVIAPGMPPAQRAAVVAVLEAWVRQYRSGRRWQLHVWDLEGAEDTWEAQLERHYRKQPVFALLSGLGGAQWLPVHRYCERQSLPCVLPNLELPPPNEGDFFSLYYSRGLALEAGALASHLRDLPTPPSRVVQVHADAAGEAAAQALSQALGEALTLQTRRYDPAAPAAALAGLKADDALVLWLRPPQLAAVSAAAEPQAPLPDLYLSAMLAPPGDTDLPEIWRPLTAYLTVFDDPARIAGQAGLALSPWLKEQGLQATDLRLQADTYAAASFFTNALGRMRGRMNRELLMETLERAVETRASAPAYPVLSLGPNQRHAVKSAGLLRYEPPLYRNLRPAGRRIVP